MYAIFRTSSFKKDYKKLNKQDKLLLKDVITSLAEGKDLEVKFRDHALSGNFLGCRECHVKPDLLLIYRVNDDILELALVNVGSHSQLFK